MDLKVLYKTEKSMVLLFLVSLGIIIPILMLLSIFLGRLLFLAIAIPPFLATFFLLRTAKATYIDKSLALLAVLNILVFVLWAIL
ncbi:MAG: hypothetical protein ACP5HW_00545 [Candidatus Micrarchaeia archaeon]